MNWVEELRVKGNELKALDGGVRLAAKNFLFSNAVKTLCSSILGADEYQISSPA